MFNKNNLPLIACGMAFMATCVVAYWYMHISADTFYLSILGQSMVQFGPAELGNWTQLYRVFPTVIVMYLSSFIFDSPLPKMWLAFIVQAAFMVAGILFLLKVLLKEQMNKNTAALVLILCTLPIYLQFHQNLVVYDTLGNSGHFGAYVLIPPIFGCVIKFLRGDSKLYIFAAGIMCFLAIVSSTAFVPFGLIPLLAYLPAYLFVVDYRRLEIRKIFWAGTICLSSFALGMWLVQSKSFIPPMSSRSLKSLLDQASWYIETIAAIPHLMGGIDVFIICLVSFFVVVMSVYLVKVTGLKVAGQRIVVTTADWTIIAFFYILIFFLLLTFFGPILSGTAIHRLGATTGFNNLRFVHPLSILTGIGFAYALNKLKISSEFFGALLLSAAIACMALDYSAYGHRNLKIIPDSHPAYFIEELKKEGVPLQNGVAQYWDAAYTAALLQNTRILGWQQMKEASFLSLARNNVWQRLYIDSDSIYNFALYNTQWQPDVRPSDDLPEGYVVYKNDKYPNYTLYYYPGPQLDQALKNVYRMTPYLWARDYTPPAGPISLIPALLPSRTGHTYGGVGRVADEKAGDKAGIVNFGPYMTLNHGIYDISIKYKGVTPDAQAVGWWDMVSVPEEKKLFRMELTVTSDEWETVRQRVILADQTPYLEVRTYFNGRGRFQVESITITPVK